MWISYKRSHCCGVNAFYRIKKSWAVSKIWMFEFSGLLTFLYWNLSKFCPWNLLFWVIKTKVLGFSAWNYTKSWRLNVFTILWWFQSLKCHNFQNFGQFWSKMAKIEKIAIFYHFSKIYDNFTEWARKLKFGKVLQNRNSKIFWVPNFWFF